MHQDKEKAPAGQGEGLETKEVTQMSNTQDISLVEMVEGEPRTDTVILAAGLEVNHRQVIRAVREFLTDLHEFGRVDFQNQPFATPGGIQTRDVASLNEQQATFLLTTFRNIGKVKDFKKALVREFYRMRNELNAPVRELTFEEKTLEVLSGLQQMVEAKDKEIAVLEPKADAYEAFMNADGTYSIGRVAKMLGRSQNKLFADLRNAGVLIAKGHMHNTPYQKYMHHFKVTPYSYERKDDTIGCSYTTTVQPSGVEFIRRKLGVPFVQHELEVVS